MKAITQRKMKGKRVRGRPRADYFENLNSEPDEILRFRSSRREERTGARDNKRIIRN